MQRRTMIKAVAFAAALAAGTAHGQAPKPLKLTLKVLPKA